MSEKVARHRQPWKPDELQKLRSLAAKGKGLKEIAKALNRTEESTKDAAREHGMTIAKLR
jgi:DNA-binding NarL/FixJ family response regulator